MIAENAGADVVVIKSMLFIISIVNLLAGLLVGQSDCSQSFILDKILSLGQGIFFPSEENQVCQVHRIS